jgi:hypothetical protein
MDDLQTFLNVREVLANFLQEDLGARDITSDNIIPAGLAVEAALQLSVALKKPPCFLIFVTARARFLLRMAQR